MKAFLARVIAFFLLQAVLFALFWNPAMPGVHNYLAATIEKHRRLESTPSPRVIIIGGSNAAFGIASKVIERELGRPLVNMGLAGPLGISFMLDEAEGEIHSGDIVVLSLEYEMFAGHGAAGALKEVVQARPANIPFLPVSRWRVLLDRDGLSILGTIVRRTFLRGVENEPGPAGAYQRERFDPEGSYTGHYGKLSTNPLWGRIHEFEMSDAIQRKISRFARDCRDRGAFCFYSCPPHPRALIDPVPAAIVHNLARLRRIPGLTVLDTPRDQEYPPNLFYDSAYHLTEEGAKQRTEKLARELRPYLSD